MIEHCEHKFTVYQMQQASGGGYYPAFPIEAQVKSCPFCGQPIQQYQLEETAPSAEPAPSPAPKSELRSKRGQGA